MTIYKNLKNSLKETRHGKWDKTANYCVLDDKNNAHSLGLKIIRNMFFFLVNEKRSRTIFYCICDKNVKNLKKELLGYFRAVFLHFWCCDVFQKILHIIKAMH